MKFNPHRYDSITGMPMFHDKDGKPDTDDKSGGVEYFTVGDDNFRKNSDNTGVNMDLF